MLLKAPPEPELAVTISCLPSLLKSADRQFNRISIGAVINLGVESVVRRISEQDRDVVAETVSRRNILFAVAVKISGNDC